MSLPLTTELFDLSHTMAAPLLSACAHPWEALPKISEFVSKLGQTLPKDQYKEITPYVWVANTARVARTAYIEGPAVICDGAEIRHCAYIRGSALIGAGAVVGNSTEVKNAILFDGVQVPHYNYVGDSVLGYLAHMGAGAIASNVRSDKKNLIIRVGEDACETGLRKIGTFLGDGVEIGCNSVLFPGSVVGRNSIVYPLTRVRGVIPANCIYKSEGICVPRLQN